MPGFELTPAMRAKRALFNAGLELPGRRLQLFAERLLAAADAWPEARPTSWSVARCRASKMALSPSSPRNPSCATSPRLVQRRPRSRPPTLRFTPSGRAS
jgi:hypothetical protein